MPIAPVSLGEGCTPLVEKEWEGARLRFKLEWFAPTSSFKDRGAAVNAAAWGSVYVEATIGSTIWRTSLFPSKQAGGWLLPLKAAVRKAEKIAEGSVVEAELALA